MHSACHWQTLSSAQFTPSHSLLQHLPSPHLVERVQCCITTGLVVVKEIRGFPTCDPEELRGDCFAYYASLFLRILDQVFATSHDHIFPRSRDSRGNFVGCFETPPSPVLLGCYLDLCCNDSCDRLLLRSELRSRKSGLFCNTMSRSVGQ